MVEVLSHLAIISLWIVIGVIIFAVICSLLNAMKHARVYNLLRIDHANKWLQWYEVKRITGLSTDEVLDTLVKLSKTDLIHCAKRDVTEMRKLVRRSEYAQYIRTPYPPMPQYAPTYVYYVPSGGKRTPRKWLPSILGGLSNT